MASNIVAIVQARIGSTRFPNKVLKNINENNVIGLVFDRLSKSKNIDKIILATASSIENNQLADFIIRKGYGVFRGNENDVLSRVYDAAKFYNASSIVRLTGDCPLIDVEIVDSVISLFKKKKADYASNTAPPTFPDGLDVEVFTYESLKKAALNAKDTFDREHVTPFIRRDKNSKKVNFYSPNDNSEERWTLDCREDFQVIKNIVNHFKPNIHFKYDDILNLKQEHPHYFEANKNIERNLGSKMGTGQKLYQRAKKIIPGGTMLLSKRPEQFLPDGWPAYYSKAKGCRIWDLDGNEYIDMSIMGIGTNTLGYSHPEVDNAVLDVVMKGNMSTLNCPEEVLLAERLIELHPWADMVRFARSGGEANAIAVRIARAAAGKDKIAICGYHGWHDWYLSANLGNDSKLDGHLLPGLDPKGVPIHLKGTVVPFRYNDPAQLENIVLNNDIGIIKMEVSRSMGPQKGYLQFVRKLASENNIILIFDECTSGFRETFGGLHKKYEVVPDMIMLGKTLGNGYAITAVVGKKRIMKYAEETFISSTFWTERIGPTAALKTLEIMEKESSWTQITETGKSITAFWKELGKNHNLKIEIKGLPSLASFTIKSENWLKYKTLITQEMLKNGFLASNLVYSCIDHKNHILDEYFDRLESVFSVIEECEKGKDINLLLEGKVCQSGFSRLN